MPRSPSPRSDTMEGMTGRVDPPHETLGEVLAARRRMHFVGRAAELDLFESALDATDPDYRVLFVHGPGGCGQEQPPGRVRQVADEAGARVVRLDGRDLRPAPTACWRPSDGVCRVPGGDGCHHPARGERGWSSSSTGTSGSSPSTSGCATRSCHGSRPRPSR